MAAKSADSQEGLSSVSKYIFPSGSANPVIFSSNSSVKYRISQQF
jgi:hypothetical protein